MTLKNEPAPKKRAQGRPTLRNETVVQKIIAGLEKGIPLTVICREDGMPAPRTVKGWQKDDAQLGERFLIARDEGEEVLAWECKAIADTPQLGTTRTKKGRKVEVREGDMIEHRKLQIDTRLKLLAKFNPRRWGDKQQIEHSGSIGLAGRLAAARQRRTGGAE